MINLTHTPGGLCGCPSRRAVLRALASVTALAGAGALAACGSTGAANGSDPRRVQVPGSSAIRARGQLNAGVKKDVPDTAITTLPPAPMRAWRSTCAIRSRRLSST
ncbi:MAG: hypothetical protein ACLTSX_10930 [Collinsella sp.]